MVQKAIEQSKQKYLYSITNVYGDTHATSSEFELPILNHTNNLRKQDIQ